MADNVTAPGTGAVLAFAQRTVGGVSVEIARTIAGFDPTGSGYSDVTPGTPLPAGRVDIGTSGAVNMAVDTAQAFAVSPAGMPGLGGEVSGTFTGTLIPEVLNVVSGTWDATSVVQRGTGLKLSAITAPLRFIKTVAASSQFRLRCSVVGTGSATIAYNLTAAQDLIGVECSDPTRTQVTTLDVGTAGFITPAPVTVTGVSGSPTLIAAARTGVVGTGRRSIILTNETDVVVRLCPSASGTNGARLAGVVDSSVKLDTQAAIYGFVASGASATVSYTELV